MDIFDNNTVNETISNDQLFSKYLPTQLEEYFYRKLSNQDPCYVKLKIAEILKYLSLAHHTPGEIHFNEELDEIWHLWILQTEQYYALMNELPEKKFIHHSSKEYITGLEIDLDEDDKIKRQLLFLINYNLNFGGFTEITIKFWPAAVALSEALSLNINELNEYLKECSYSECLHDTLV